MSGMVRGIYGVSEWIMRIAVTNMLWLLFNFPIVFLLLLLLFGDKSSGMIVFIVPIFLLAPFIFFPATAAMFSLIRDWMMDKDPPSIISGYWFYYLENFRKSMVAGLFLSALWGIWAIDIQYFSEKNTVVTYIFVVFGILLYVFSINFFSINAHFNVKVSTLLKKAVIVTIGSPLLSTVIFVSSGVILYVSVNALLFLLIFFAGSLIAFISFSVVFRLYFNTINSNK